MQTVFFFAARVNVRFLLQVRVHRTQPTLRMFGLHHVNECFVSVVYNAFEIEKANTFLSYIHADNSIAIYLKIFFVSK